MKKAVTLCLFFTLIKFSFSQDIKVFEKFNDFEPYLHISNDSTYVVNFWATWCVPCIKEMPHFQKLHDEYKKEKLKVLLVSIDMTSKINSALIPFIEKNKLTPEVVVLDDPKQNSWINKVNEDWQGSIPATLIYNKWNRKFYEQTFEYEQLEEVVKTFIN